MPNDIIKINNLSKRYKNATSDALNSISLEIEQNCFFGLLGPNGSGKTTLISILCGMLAADKGNVLICDHNINSMNAIKPLIGLVPQKIALYPTLTLKENLQFFANLYEISHQDTVKRINEYLNIFEMENYTNKIVNTFSGGIMRRANLIAGILHNPKVLFLDEPTANVDAYARNIIFNNLRELHSRGMSVVYTTHYMEEVEALCSKVAILKSGNLVANDFLANLKNYYPEKITFTDIYLSLTE